MSEAEDQLQSVGVGRLHAFMTALAEGETREGVANIGRSKYLIFFPVLQRTLGLEIKIIAAPGQATQYLARVTKLSNNQEAIARELFSGE